MGVLHDVNAFSVEVDEGVGRSVLSLSRGEVRRGLPSSSFGAATTN
jgi:hypothetical protein